MPPEQTQEEIRDSIIMDETSITSLKQMARTWAAQRRRDREYGGFLWQNLPIDSSPAGQARLTAAAIAAKEGWRRNDALWKFADGSFRPVNNRNVIDLARALIVYVQACFDEEAALAQKINTEKDIGVLRNLLINLGLE